MEQALLNVLNFKTVEGEVDTAVEQIKNHKLGIIGHT
jgi:hypothetical protein